MALPLRTALAALLLLGAPAAGAAEPAALARSAAQHCQARQADQAAAALRQLLDALEAQLGAGHDATLVVRLNLAHVERARGNEAEAAELEQLPKGDSKGKAHKSLERALKKLRVCAALPASGAPSAPEVALSDRVNLARNQLNRGKYRDALKVAEDARRIGSSGARADELMRLNETLALIYLQLGRSDDALRAAAAAERHARSAGDVEVRITMARLAGQSGDYERAERELEELAAAAASRQQRAELEEARGELALRLGSPRRALAHLDRALAAHREAFGSKAASTAAVIQLRGDAYRLAGDFPAALASYNEARDIRRVALGAKHAESARSLNALGVLQADIGDWQAADETFGAAHQTLRAALGADHPEILTVRSNRALARWGATRSAEAAAEYASVVEGLSGSLGEDHPSTAAATRNLARMELDLGRAERAADLLDRALAAQTRSLGESHPGLAPTRIARARVLARRGDLTTAAAEVDRAVAVLVEARGLEHPTVIRARTLRARIGVAAGDSATALREALLASQALASYTRHTFGALTDRQRALLADDSQDVVGALLSVGEAPARELFAALLPHRDAVLRSVAADQRAGGELAALRRRYVAAVVGAGSGAAARARELTAKIDALEARADAGARASELTPEQVLARACERLPADAALVKFVVFDRTGRGAVGSTEPALAALVVRGASCSVTRVGFANAADIDAAAERFAAAMREERNDDPKARAELGSALLAPLRAPLDDATRWLVIPDGALWGVPLGVLPDPDDPKRYLFERITLGYLTSTHELAEAADARTPVTAGLPSVLVGAPDFGDIAGGGPVVLTRSGPCQLEPFEDLPATQSEIEEVGELVGGGRRLSGVEASKTRLESELAQGPWLVHLATHAYFAGSAGCGSEDAAPGWRQGEEPIAPNPLLLSGIVLAGANESGRVGDGGASGILTAYEVAGLDLSSAGLVVLSACDTGTGLQQRGQEVQGLRWGFRAAGARALVTSLWRSNDVATRRLMRAFYDALVAGELPEDAFRGAEALRRAQLAQVQGERRLGLQRPLVWANFIFSGVL